MKLITVLQSKEAVNGKLDDMTSLNLPKVWERKIAQIIHDNRMLYEPRLETAKDFNELRSRLKHRGYSDIPMGANPMLDMKAYAKAPEANTSSVKVQKTMIRKKK